MTTSSQIALGTVQFGQSYGIAGSGQVAFAEVGRILDYSRRIGIDTIDTAINYGTAEACLGQAGVQDLRVITKLPGLPEHGVDLMGWVSEQIQGSLQRLQLSKIYGVLLHRPDQLLQANGPALYRAIRACQTQGLVEKIGVSIYQPEELDAFPSLMQFDLVQAPFNILDRRWSEAKWLENCHAKGIELHIRSVFLQGLLLMSPADRPTKFHRWQALWEVWESWLATNRLTPLEACLRYALSFSEIARVVVGVDSLAQLQQIVSTSFGDIPTIPEGMQTIDPDLLNPSRWNSL